MSHLFGSKSWCNDTSNWDENTDTSPEPNPYAFEIIGYIQKNGYLLLEVKYKHCSTYDGRKYLLFINENIEKIKNIKKLDPHFLENNLSLIARIRPNNDGINMIKKIMGIKRIYNGN